MTPSSHSMIVAVLVAVCAAPSANAQASPPPPPKQDVTPALLPPPAAAPRPETVAPRTRVSAQVAPQATESAVRATPVPLRRASAPVDSVRPVIAPAQQAQSVREVPQVDPPPARPATGQSVQNAAEPASARDGPPPVGATARCKDGTYLFAPTSEQSCRERGGLVLIFSPRPAPPTPPRRP